MVPQKSALWLKKVPNSFLPLLLHPCPHLCSWKCEGMTVAHGQRAAGERRALWRGHHLPKRKVSAHFLKIGGISYMSLLTCMKCRNQSPCGCHSELWRAGSFSAAGQQHQVGSWYWVWASPFWVVMSHGRRNWLMCFDAELGHPNLDCLLVAGNVDTQDLQRGIQVDLSQWAVLDSNFYDKNL